MAGDTGAPGGDQQEGKAVLTVVSDTQQATSNIDQFGQKATQTFTDVGNAADKSARKTRDATDRAIAALQRQAAEYKSVAEGITKVEALGQIRNDVKQDRLAPVLEQLRQYKAAAEQVAAAEKQIADATKLRAVVAEAANAKEKAAYNEQLNILEKLRAAAAVGQNKRDQKDYADQLKQEAAERAAITRQQEVAQDRADKLHATVLEAQNKRERAAYEERARNTQKLIELVQRLRNEQEKASHLKGEKFLEDLRTATAQGQNRRDQKDYATQLKEEALARERADKLHATVLEAQNRREKAAYEERARNTQKLTDLVVKLRQEQEKEVYKKGQDFQASLAAQNSALERQAQMAGKSASELLALEVAEKRLQASLMGVGQAAEQQIVHFQRLKQAQIDAAEATKGDAFVKGLQQRLTLGTTSPYERLIEEAKKLGRLKEAEPLIKQLAEVEKGFTGAGKASALAARQMALVGPQITDIVTQLQMGTDPLTIMVQQGGQLIDIFGGLGGALRGIGAGLLSLLVNPLVIAGVSAIALATAIYQARTESDQFNKAIVMTGNAVGTTVSQLEGMAEAIGNSSRLTVGAASEALAAMVNTGRVGTQNLAQFARQAAELEKVGGPAVKETADAFKDLAKAPLESLLKLDEGMNFLTKDTYEHIKSLERQGRQTDAATAAQEAYSRAIQAQIDGMRAQLGPFQRLLDDVATSAKKMWDEVLNQFRPASLDKQIEAAKARIAELTGFQTNGFKNAGIADAVKFGLPFGGKERLQEELKVQQEQLNVLSRQKLVEDNAAASSAARAEEKRVFLELEKQYGSLALSNLTKEERAARLEAEKTRLRQMAVQAKWDEAKLATLIAAREKEYEDPKEPKGSRAPFNDANRADVEAVRQTEQLKQEEIRRSLDLVAHLRDMERISERAAIEDTARLEIESLRTRAEALREQADIVAKKENATGEAASLRRQAALIDSQIITRQRREMQELAEAQERLIRASDAEALRQYTQAQEEETTAIRDAAIARTEYHAQQLEQARSLEEEQRFLQLEASMIGQTDDARRVALETLRIQIALERELDDIRLNRGNDPDAIAQAQANAAKATALVQQRATLEVWDQTASMVQDTLADAIIEGGDKGAKSLKRMFDQLVLRPIVSAIVQPISGTIGAAAAGLLGGSGGGGSGGGAALNGVSSLSSIYNAYTGASIAGLGTTISGIGSFFGSSSMAAYGAGMGMTSAQAAAAAAAYQSAAAAGGSSAATYAATGSAISAGSATGSALSTIGSYIPYVAVVLAVLNAFGLFRSNKPVGGGLMGTVGDGGDLDSYTLMRRGGTLFSGPSYSIRTNDADPTLAKGIQDAVFGMLNQARAQAETIGLRGNLARFTAPLGSDLIHPEVGRYGIKLDGLSQEDAVKKIQEEIGKLAEKMADQALGSEGKGFAKIGETATQTLGRLSDSLQAVNQALKTFGDNLLANTLGGGDAASKLIDLFGGKDAFNQTSQAYYQAYFSDAERAAQATRELQAGFAAMGAQFPQTRDELRRMIEAQDLTTDKGRTMYAGLMQISLAYDAVTKATEEQREAELDRQRAIAQERAGIEQQILQLQGNTAELRRRELEKLDPANRALQQYLFTLQDAADAAQRAAQVEQERLGLEGTLLQLQGNTAELRRRELEALDPANRAIQTHIHALQDQQAAAQQAAAVAEERKGLEQQLLELQGNTTELRRRELEALDPSNRALQEQINSLRDAADAAQKAKEMRDAWKQVGETIEEEIRRIRGLSAETTGGGFTFLQAQFATTTAQARAGDQEAAQRLPELSAALLKAAADSASTAAELATIQGATANSLEQTMKLLQSLGVEVPGFAAGGLFGGGMRIVGENGPELEVTGPARIFSAQQTAAILSGGISAADLQRVIDAVDRLHDSMRVGHGVIANNTARAATVLEAVAPEGEFLNIKEFTA